MLRKAAILVTSLALLMGWLVAGKAPAEPTPSDTINAYYSPNLRVDFRLDAVQIPDYPPFYGGRIVSLNLDDTSPLKVLKLKYLDVVTCLDDIPIATGASRVSTPTGGYWALPEMEKHVGWTKVRYIRHGSITSSEGWVYLGEKSAPPMPPMPPIPPVSPIPPSSPN